MDHRLIIHLITGLNVGGAESVLASLLESFAPDERAHHCVISLIEADTPVADRIRELGVPVSSLGMKPGRPTLGALRRLMRELSASPPWAIHAWMYHANLLASLACLLGGHRRAHLWAIHNGLEGLERQKRLTRATIRVGAWLSRLPAAIVYVAARSADQHEAQGYKPTRRVVIPNGHDLTRFKPDPGARARLGLPASFTGPVIGHVARWNWAKDHANFLAALAHIPTAYGVMIGRDVDKDNRELEELIRHHGVGKRVRLMGLRDDVHLLMPGFDVFCLSSRSESLPGVVCEAMACGVPCVATDVGGVQEIVGDTGLVIPPENAEALAEALRTLITRPDRPALGQKARERVEKLYDIRRMTQAYLTLYARLGWRLWT